MSTTPKIVWNKITKDPKIIFSDPSENETLIPFPGIEKDFYIWETDNWVIDESKRDNLISMAINIIDTATDTVILTGFAFDGHNFKLSSENQINFQTECSLRDSLTYPHRVKAIDGYFDFESADQYQQFYLAGITFIRQTIESGWAQKDALSGKTAAELIQFINNQQ